MAQKEIEIILARQWASYLATPIFLVDTSGTLLFYNESAEKILGRRFDETGEMAAREWATAFNPTDQGGKPMSPEELPLLRALRNRHPEHGAFEIRGWDNVQRHIEVTAFPLIGQENRCLGAMAIFWESVVK